MITFPGTIGSTISRRSLLKRMFASAAAVATLVIFGEREAYATACSSIYPFTSSCAKQTCSYPTSPAAVPGKSTCIGGISPNGVYDLACNQCSITNPCNPAIECCSAVYYLDAAICNNGCCACETIVYE